MSKIVILIACSLVVLSAADTDATVSWAPGCLAKIYLCGKAEVPEGNEVRAGSAWPIKALPDAPAEVLQLPNLPQVDAPPASDLANKGTESNPLVVSKKRVLDLSTNFYAVEFEGYYLSTTDGVYTIAVTSDDPVELFVEGKSLLKSDVSANPNLGRVGQYGDYWAADKLNSPNLLPETTAVQASLRLAPNRYYHVVVLARQQWYRTSKLTYGNHPFNARDLNRGAVLRSTICTPDGKTAPLSLFLPTAK